MKFSKNKFGLLIFGFMGFVFLSGCLVTSADAAKEIPLSAIVEKINQEQVESITVQGHNIEVELKDGTRLYSKKEPEISLSESLLSYGVNPDKLRNVIITVKEERGFAVWIWPLLLFILPFIIFIVWFIVFYFLILLGFKILKIKEAPKSKIIIYIFVMFLIGLFLNYAIPSIFKEVSNKFVLYSIHFLISFGIVFLLLKYYFLLSGKKLWQFILYLIVLNLILSTVAILIQFIPMISFLIRPLF